MCYILTDKHNNKQYYVEKFPEIFDIIENLNHFTVIRHDPNIYPIILTNNIDKIPFRNLVSANNFIENNKEYFIFTKK